MKTAESLIGDIKIDKENILECMDDGEIKGKLLLQFKKAMKEYASQALDEAALKTTDVELSKAIYGIKSDLK